MSYANTDHSFDLDALEPNTTQSQSHEASFDTSPTPGVFTDMSMSDLTPDILFNDVWDLFIDFEAGEGIPQSTLHSPPLDSSSHSAERQTVNLVGWMMRSHQNWATFRDAKGSAFSRGADLTGACTLLAEELSAGAKGDDGVEVHAKALARFLREPGPDDARVEPTDTRASWSLCPRGTWPSYYSMERNPAVYHKFLRDPEYMASFVDAATHVSIKTHSDIDAWMKYPLGESIAKTLLGWCPGPRSSHLEAHPSKNESRRLWTISIAEEMWREGETHSDMKSRILDFLGYTASTGGRLFLVDEAVRALYPPLRLHESSLRKYYSSRRKAKSALRDLSASPFFQNRDETLKVYRGPGVSGSKSLSVATIHLSLRSIYSCPASKLA